MNFVDPKEIDIPSHGTKNRYKTILPSKWVSPWSPAMTFSPALRMYCCRNLTVFDCCVPIHKCIYSLCRKTTKTQCCRTGKCRALSGCLCRCTLWQHPNHILKCSLGACWFSLEDSSGRWAETALPCLAVAPPVWRMRDQGSCLHHSPHCLAVTEFSLVGSSFLGSFPTLSAPNYKKFKYIPSFLVVNFHLCKSSGVLAFFFSSPCTSWLCGKLFMLVRKTFSHSAASSLL